MQEKKNAPAQPTQNHPHKLELDHLHGASMTGVQAVPTFTDKSLTIRLKDETLFVTGQNLEIKVLDVENGKLVIAGVISSLKYSAASAPTSFLKRVFK